MASLLEGRHHAIEDAVCSDQAFMGMRDANEKGVWGSEQASVIRLIPKMNLECIWLSRSMFEAKNMHVHDPCCWALSMPLEFLVCLQKVYPGDQAMPQEFTIQRPPS